MPNQYQNPNEKMKDTLMFDYRSLMWHLEFGFWVFCKVDILGRSCYHFFAWGPINGA
jgi:hypothetical protein